MFEKINMLRDSWAATIAARRSGFIYCSLSEFMHGWQCYLRAGYSTPMVSSTLAQIQASRPDSFPSMSLPGGDLELRCLARPDREAQAKKGERRDERQESRRRGEGRDEGQDEGRDERQGEGQGHQRGKGAKGGEGRDEGQDEGQDERQGEGQGHQRGKGAKAGGDRSRASRRASVARASRQAAAKAALRLSARRRSAGPAAAARVELSRRITGALKEIRQDEEHRHKPLKLIREMVELKAGADLSRRQAWLFFERQVRKHLLPPARPLPPTRRPRVVLARRVDADVE